MAYWRLFYQFVWATKEREPLLDRQLEAHVHRYLVSKGSGVGALMFALNGMEDHLHVVAAVPPRVSPADFVKRLKGSSSRFVTKEFDLPFAWQEGYGVFSITESDLQRLVSYVKGQKQHHRQGTLVAAWERMDVEDDSPRLAG
ncbi:MAG: IS200/IS605 family transposase [Chloroflexi bacterium B3_Chlor]|nr:MAG: IS200/IS605 family transposase [Chloroflexi bacterium B3_Chlor]